MKHTKAVTRKPAQAQSAYASKLQFKQEWSTLITSGIGSLSNIGLATFVNSLGLGAFIDIIFGDDTTTT